MFRLGSAARRYSDRSGPSSPKHSPLSGCLSSGCDQNLPFYGGHKLFHGSQAPQGQSWERQDPNRSPSTLLLSCIKRRKARNGRVNIHSPVHARRQARSQPAFLKQSAPGIATKRWGLQPKQPVGRHLHQHFCWDNIQHGSLESAQVPKIVT